MDVKSTFFNGILDEQVYIEQPEGFTDPSKRDIVCKLCRHYMDSSKLPKLGIKDFKII